MGGPEARVSRRSFDHFHAELSVEIGKLVPRYALWLEVQEAGFEPDALKTGDTLRFIHAHLAAFLRSEGLSLSDRKSRRLNRRLRQFDPDVPTPYETMERLFSSPDKQRRRSSR